MSLTPPCPVPVLHYFLPQQQQQMSSKGRGDVGSFFYNQLLTCAPPPHSLSSSAESLQARGPRASSTETESQGGKLHPPSIQSACLATRVVPFKVRLNKGLRTHSRRLMPGCLCVWKMTFCVPKTPSTSFTPPPPPIFSPSSRTRLISGLAEPGFGSWAFSGQKYLNIFHVMSRCCNIKPHYLSLFTTDGLFLRFSVGRKKESNLPH